MQLKLYLLALLALMICSDDASSQESLIRNTNKGQQGHIVHKQSAISRSLCYKYNR